MAFQHELCRAHLLWSSLAPEALVGRQVRVLWVGDDAWFMGNVTAYDPETGKHKLMFMLVFVDCTRPMAKGPGSARWA
eukprot:scaffold247355_cov24-Tisochrysis_lutea.AAC.1